MIRTFRRCRGCEKLIWPWQQRVSIVLAEKQCGGVLHRLPVHQKCFLKWIAELAIGLGKPIRGFNVGDLAWLE